MLNLEVIFTYTNLEVINKNSYEMKLTWTNKVVGITMLFKFRCRTSNRGWVLSSEQHSFFVNWGKKLKSIIRLIK